MALVDSIASAMERAAMRPTILRYFISSSALISPSMASKILGVRQGATEWLYSAGLVRNVGGRDLVCWGDVVLLHRADSAELRHVDKGAISAAPDTVKPLAMAEVPCRKRRRGQSHSG